MVLSERVPLQVDDELVYGRFAQGMEVSGQSELTQCAANVLMFDSKLLDFVPMRGSDEREQPTFFRIEVVTEMLLEMSPLFTQCWRIRPFERTRQLGQE